MKKSAVTAPSPRKFIVVTTAHRGVFAGYGVPDPDAKTIRLEEARMCVKWTEDIKGVVGLASLGPSKHCRISPAAPSMILQDVTSIMEVSPEAEAKWKSQPWA